MAPSEESPRLSTQHIRDRVNTSILSVPLPFDGNVQHTWKRIHSYVFPSLCSKLDIMIEIIFKTVSWSDRRTNYKVQCPRKKHLSILLFLYLPTSIRVIGGVGKMETRLQFHRQLPVVSWGLQYLPKPLLKYTPHDFLKEVLFDTSPTVITHKWQPSCLHNFPVLPTIRETVDFSLRSTSTLWTDSDLICPLLCDFT